MAKDIPYRVKWLNNHEVNKYIGDKLRKKTTLKREKAWFDNYKKAKDKKFFTICDNAKLIGFMGLSNISRQNKNADLFIAIGDDDYRGQGIGAIALRWLIDYGFKRLRLHKINLGVIKNNLHAIAVYRSLGFIVEGKMKDEVFHCGKYYDFWFMAIFKRKSK